MIFILSNAEMAILRSPINLRGAFNGDPAENFALSH